MLPTTMAIGITATTRNAVVTRSRGRSGYSTENRTGCSSFMCAPSVSRSADMVALVRLRGADRVDGPCPSREDLEPDHLAVAQLEDVRPLLADLHAAAPPAAVVGREHHHVVAQLEVFVGLRAPLRPLDEPGLKARIGIPVVRVDATEARELVGPTPLHMRVVDLEPRPPVALA